METRYPFTSAVNGYHNSQSGACKVVDGGAQAYVCRTAVRYTTVTHVQYRVMYVTGAKKIRQVVVERYTLSVTRRTARTVPVLISVHPPEKRERVQRLGFWFEMCVYSLLLMLPLIISVRWHVQLSTQAEGANDSCTTYISATLRYVLNQLERAPSTMLYDHAGRVNAQATIHQPLSNRRLSPVLPAAR